jgi:uncharacterized protein YndB with AHSA1/START domain
MDLADVPRPGDQGTVVLDDGVPVLRFERVVAASPEKLWEALTTSASTAAWAFPVEFEPRSGGTLTFDAGEMGPVTGDVMVWEEQSVLEYAWGGSEGAWHVRFVIEEAGDSGDSVLTFDHLAPDPHHPDFAAGWHWHLDRLEQFLRGETPADVPQDEHFEELQRLYAHAEG